MEENMKGKFVITKTMKKIITMFVSFVYIISLAAPFKYVSYAAANTENKNDKSFSAPNLDNLPKPVLDDHPEWIELYNKAWQIASKKIEHGKPENGFVESYMDAAFNSDIFQWDTAFITMFGKYSNGEFPSIESLENFYLKQHEDGYICREISKYDGKDITFRVFDDTVNPPIFSWAEWENYTVTGDSSRFTKLVNGKTVLQHIIDNYNWIKNNRRRDNGLYWTTPLASGADNTPNEGHTWVDLSAQQALNAYYIAKMAEKIGDLQTRDTFNNEYNELKQLINNKLWDKQNGFYHNLNQDGSFLMCKTPAGFWPMIAGIPDKNQLDKITDHIVNPNEFWRKHVIPSLSADDPKFSVAGDYWLGAVWAPWMIQTVKGLELNGYDKLAQDISINHVNNIYEVYQNTGTIWENYSADLAKQGSPARGEFVGWTGGGPIQLLIENILGIRVDAPKDSLTWDINLTERNGIENFHFGDNIVSIVSDKRNSELSPANITVTTNNKFTLNVKIGDKTYSRTVEPGTSKVHFDGGNDSSIIVSAMNINLKSDVGVKPVLPETVSVVYSDKSVGEAKVLWDKIEKEKYTKPGTFKVAGTIKGTSIKVEATVTVREVLRAEVISTETKIGVEPQLPEKVTAIFTDNSRDKVNVIWDKIDPVKYKEEGTFTAKGYVEGTEVEVIANVTVGKYFIKLEAEYADLSGGSKFANNHSGYSGAGFVDGYNTWNKGASTTFTINMEKAGDYVVDLRYANAMSEDMTLSVYVNDKKIKQTVIPRLDNWDMWAKKGEILHLEKGRNTIAYKFSNEDTGNVNIDCITIGELTTISKLNSVNAATQIFTPPALPSYVTAIYADGTETMLPVKWDNIDPVKYAKPGSFIVEGSVENAPIKAVANITVYEGCIDLSHNNSWGATFGQPVDQVKRWQTFTVGNYSVINSIDLMVQRASGSDQSDMIVELYSAENNKPEGNPLVSAVVPAKSINSTWTIVNVPLSCKNLALEGKYAIVLGQKEPGSAVYYWSVSYKERQDRRFGKFTGTDWIDESFLGDGWMKVYVSTEILSGVQ